MEVEAYFDDVSQIDIYNYLKKMGIKDPRAYINPSYEYIEDYSFCASVQKGITLIEECLLSNEHIYILQDSDVDGLCSAAIAYQFLINIGVNMNRIKVVFHQDKSHNLTSIIDEVATDCKFLWVPDAGTNDVVECKKLYEKGIKILITDHHQSSTVNPFAVIVNNQIETYINNKDLCGTGVTFKFIAAYCQKHSLTFYKKFIDMVMLANIADVMSFVGYENRLFNIWGLKKIKNPFLKYLCSQFIKDEITPISMAFNLIPKLNAIQRIGTQDDKIKLFKNFVGLSFKHEEMFNILKKVHNKQKNDVLKLYHKCLEDTPINSQNVIIQEIKSTPYTGLVANKLMDYYKRPILLVFHHKETKEYMGSLRSPVPLKQILAQSGLFTLLQGHNQACGVGWKDNQLTNIIQYCRSINIDIKPSYKVMLSCSEPMIPTSLFMMSEKYKKLWCNDIIKPMVHFNNITFNGLDIKELKGNGVKFKIGMIDFIKFGVSNKLKEELHIGENQLINMDIIGELNINTWNNNINLQINMKEIEIK